MNSVLGSCALLAVLHKGGAAKVMQCFHRRIIYCDKPNNLQDSHSSWLPFHTSSITGMRYENISLFPKDINRLLGNRLPGERKVLRLIFLCSG